MLRVENSKSTVTPQDNKKQTQTKHGSNTKMEINLKKVEQLKQKEISQIKMNENRATDQQMPSDIVERVQVTLLSARASCQTSKLNALSNMNQLSTKFNPTQQQTTSHQDQSKQPSTSHSHHQSLSETRSLQSFRSLQDERFHRKLTKKHESSVQSSNSQTRQVQGIRDLIQGEQEVKQFEQKFSGSLQKLDAFEKEWQEFKVNLHGGVLLNDLDQSMGNALGDTSLQNQSFSNTQFKSQERTKQNQEESKAYSTTGGGVQSNQTLKKENSKDVVRGRQFDFRNQLDQIVESPRESILQSPTTQPNIKLANIYQSKSAFSSVQKAVVQVSQAQSNGANNASQCKTLKIDLNEEITNFPSALSKHPSNDSSQLKLSENINKMQQPSNQNKLFKTPSQNQQQITLQNKKPQNLSNYGLSQVSLKLQTSDSKEQKTKQSFEQVSQLKGDNLIERVMESIKVLNKKEEEQKQSQQPKKSPDPSNLKMQQEQSKASINDSLLQPQLMRKRTNTLTIGERPNIFNNLTKNVAAKENNLPSSIQSKKSSPQAMNTQIQPSGPISGFIGNSFIKNAATNLQQSQNFNEGLQSQAKFEIKDEPTKVESVTLYAQKIASKNMKEKSNELTQKSNPQFSQGSKEKVDMLRRAFTSNKDNPSSRSTKNLATPQQNQSSNMTTNHSSKGSQPHNFKLQSQSTSNSTKNQNNSIAIVSGAGLMKQEKGTKRADISLIQEQSYQKTNTSIHSQSQFQNNSSSLLHQPSLNDNILPQGTVMSSPSKAAIQNIKKNGHQITPKQKLNQTSPNQTLNNVSLSQGSSSTTNNNIMAPSQKTTLTHQANLIKGKNRRQPTQTNFDVANNNVSSFMIKEKEQERIEAGADKLWKPKTMLDDYKHSSPDQHKLIANASQGNSHQVSLNKVKNMSLAQQELREDLSSSDKGYNESEPDYEPDYVPTTKKQLNFQPTQQPSVNWNETPNKQVNEKQQFALKLGNILPEMDEIVDIHIEERLNDLLEETRRKMFKYEKDEPTEQSDESPMQSEDNDGFDPHLQQQQQQQMNYYKNLRGKAQTPGVESLTYTQQYNPQPQVSIPVPHQQPFLYEQQPYQIVYGAQPQYPPQYAQVNNAMYPPSQQSARQAPVITIINPPLQYQQQQQQYQQHFQQFGPPLMNPQSQQFQQQQPPPQQQQQYQRFNTHLKPQQQNYQKNEQNTSMIIGVDSQFFYPPKSSSLETSYNQDDEYIPPNNKRPQQQIYQQQPYYQQPQYIMVGMPPNNLSGGRPSLDNTPYMNRQQHQQREYMKTDQNECDDYQQQPHYQ